ncbi:shikimate kinase [Spirulina subsalsa FACHB-351]|uniref:Shikimate kinase n=1 Tax=Spirulina subsalsa FACHB-351 TaxID=234711 RepID=A0ABT3LA06_9CYAN|nr:shikimate kinase [Spirulina subsalsa]MCW6038348.1 shikimate kinase [Spirulina subsalsa FACHB-351]
MVAELLQGMSVFLVGMMGCGKSTVGETLARQWGYRFLDTDSLIEQVGHTTIADIFAREGEAAFRDLESQVLEQVCAYTRCAIATGGGIVIRPRNWSYLQNGLVIWLDAPVPLLVQRLQGDTTRPLLDSENLSARLAQLLEQRHSFYSQADLKITLEPEQTPEQIVQAIREQIPSVLKTVHSKS